MELKICNVCEGEYPPTKEYFYINKTNSIDGLFPYCKKCSKEKATNRNIKFKEEIKEHNKESKHNRRGVKPPFNYMGNKYYMFPELRGYFPEDIECFIDIMCGSGFVGANAISKRLLLNDIDRNMIDCLTAIYSNADFYDKVTEIKITSLEDYKNNVILFNKINDPILFYVLVQNAFNQSPQYNDKGEFNAPYGNGGCYLNDNLLNRIKTFSDMTKLKNITFSSSNFLTFYDYKFKENDFVFIDPPYGGSKATYNRFWNGEDDDNLFLFINFLNKSNIKFLMTNSAPNATKFNADDKYKVERINKSKYKSSNKNKSESDEIIIFNY